MLPTWTRTRRLRELGWVGGALLLAGSAALAANRRPYRPPHQPPEWDGSVISTRLMYGDWHRWQRPLDDVELDAVLVTRSGRDRAAISVVMPEHFRYRLSGITATCDVRGELETDILGARGAQTEFSSWTAPPTRCQIDLEAYYRDSPQRSTLCWNGGASAHVSCPFRGTARRVPRPEEPHFVRRQVDEGQRIEFAFWLEDVVPLPRSVRATSVRCRDARGRTWRREGYVFSDEVRPDGVQLLGGIVADSTELHPYPPRTCEIEIIEESEGERDQLVARFCYRAGHERAVPCRRR